MNYFTCKVGIILLQKKGRKPLLLLAYNHTVFSFKKSKKNKKL